MRYLTTTEVAAMLHVDPSRVRLLCKLGGSRRSRSATPTRSPRTNWSGWPRCPAAGQATRGDVASHAGCRHRWCCVVTD